MSTVIKVENLSKQYRLGTVGTGTLSSDLNRWWAMLRGKEDPTLVLGEANDRTQKGNSDFVWSLKDVSFEVQQGDVLGIIGRNGAGKSTLLKILSRTTTPTTGSFKVKGRIASLLEVGTGFHPELTGRENIYLNGAILGMRKHEITRKFDEIVAFSGVERYIDTPVKRYSSGMYVRLAFAVAAHLEPEILIVDEVLAVGDMEFQKKCLGKMKDVSEKEGRTVLFVSHNMAAVQNLCNKGLLLKHGTVASIDNDIRDTINKYIDTNASVNAERTALNTQTRKGNGVIQFNRIAIIDSDANTEISEIPSGTNVKFRFFFDAKQKPLKSVIFSFSINDQLDQRVAFLSNEMINSEIEINDTSKNYIDVTINKIPLAPGTYNMNIFCTVKGDIADWLQQAYYFNIVGGDFYNTGRKYPDGHGVILMNYLYA
jgi:lipopolysaccharide transport system ATP-binding protein